MAAKRALTPKAFVKRAGEKNVGGAYILYGQESYIKSETARLAVEAHVPADERTYSVTHLVAGQTDAGEILAAAQAIPLLGNNTAVVVHDAQKLAASHKTKLTPALPKIGPPTLVILIGPAELDKRTKFYKWFADEGRHVVCNPLDEAQAEVFAKREIAKEGKEISADGLASLIAHVGPDAGTLAREAEKLAIFAGDRAEITREDVDTVTGQSRGSNIEEWITAQLKSDMPKTLAITRSLLESGSDAATLVGRLAMHYFDLYRTLLSGERIPYKLAGAIRVPTARAEQLCTWAKLADPRRVQRAIEHISDADFLVKSGRTDPVGVTDALAIALSSGNNRNRQTVNP